EIEIEKLVQLGMFKNRAETVRRLARAAADGQLRLEPGVDVNAMIEQVRAIPGIGEWTAQYIAMRALGWPDAFPHGDVGLLRGLGEKSFAGLRTIAEAWRPWRAYAVMQVWNGLGSSSTSSKTRKKS